MNRRIAGLLIAVLLAGGLVIAISAADGNGSPWVGAEAAVNISHTQDVMDEGSLALGPGERAAVIWAGADNQGVFLAQAQEGNWDSPATTLASGQATWYPTVAYSGTEVIAAWAQGAARYPRGTPSAVMQRDASAPQAQTIITPVYGNIEIGLVVAPTGMHMIFAATTNMTITGYPWDLYYTHRYFTETTWMPPTVIITYAQVLPAGTTPAGIWSPRLAVNNDGTQFHVVWEQESTAFTHTIWYASGLWQAGHIDWATPQQVSPPSQRYTVRPNVAVGATGKVHIVWTELIPGSGSITKPEEQHINYIQLGDPAPIRINGEAIRANDNKPTWSTSSLAVNGNHLCATWHGFYAPPEMSGIEDIFMRCSQDEGESWQFIVNVSESTQKLSIFPTVKVASGGQVHVTWAEFVLPLDMWVPDDFYYRTGTSDVNRIFLPLVMRKA
ncbi:MAG: hypothetical protein JXR84_15455 [Anaerolineae bacterium]|nr:hypothetical protein [Anaerolineae bacterium]